MTKRAVSSNIALPQAMQRLLGSQAGGGYATVVSDPISNKFAETFKDHPPIQKPNSFTIDDALAMMADATTGK